MGWYDFTINAFQSGQIRELEERIEKLEKQNEILYEWVQYFRQQELKNDLSKSQHPQS